MGLFSKKITYEKALHIARAYYREYKVVKAWDLDDAWLFCYDFDSLSMMGTYNILVSKADGSVTPYHPPEYKGTKPSEENLVFDATEAPK